MSTIKKFSKVIIVVMKNPGLRQVNIARLTGLEKSQVCRLLQAGKETGLIKEVARTYYPGDELARV